MQAQTQSGTGTQLFPFKLEDLKAWVVRRKDGTVTKFTLVQGTSSTKYQSNTQISTKVETQARTTSKLSEFCHHKPVEPIASFDRGELGVLRLYVGNMGGAKATKDDFDLIVDCGDIFNSWLYEKTDVLTGDNELVQLLKPFTICTQMPNRLLKIDWTDRQAPNVIPEFWTHLSKAVSGDVMTCCVGGHGRSGTSFVCLLLNNAPDYDALDAIIHLRAAHCPRAIESKVQHEYIDNVAKYLGRQENAGLAGSIKDYKGAFMACKKPTAVATRKMLGWE